jgi:N-terminal 7TM region of histidine kinase
MSNDLLIVILQRFNEAISAATVIVAASMLLYNLRRGLRDRVVRSSSVLLGCVTATYIGDVFLGLARAPSSIEAWLRFQWIGIAFAPAALFHLSDALLATTGVISRGRRRRVVRILYLYGVVFLLTATGTNLIIQDPTLIPVPMMHAGPLFGLYLIYFAAATIFAVNNVLRARRRCLTTATHRRMTYLLLAFLTPSAGIFPYSLLFTNPSHDSLVWLWLLVNLGNVGIVLMLAFMAYPLSFFGSNKPDRVIKAQLLRFMLRGPVVGVAVLLVILFVPATRLLGLPGDELMPFAAVATVLCLQWAMDLLIPRLERILIYTRDQDQARQIQEFSDRLLTQADAHQLLEATLAAICDYLRVPSAFVASLGSNGAQLEQVVGPLLPSQTWLSSPEFTAVAAGALPDDLEVHGDLMVWQSFWLIPLRSARSNSHADGRVVGILGVWARSAQPDFQPEEEKIFKMLYTRAARVLDDMRLQEDVFAALEDVLLETTDVRQVTDPMRYGNALALARSSQEIVNSPEFADLVRDALRDYWGGPRLTESRLLGLNVVSRAVAENEGNPAHAVRAVLSRAIESLKPEGERSLTTTEWMLYNILDMRFVQGRKVRDVTLKLAMSEADLFRKQKFAIAEVARKIAEMEEREIDGGNGSHA